MNEQAQIDGYIADQTPSKRSDLQDLHRLVLKVSPECKLWFLDGKNSDGKVVSNPNIGYGNKSIKYANGEAREFYQLGLSANTTGISIYVMGIEDKKYLSETYAPKIGKAKITGYCIKFRGLGDLDMSALEEMISDIMDGRLAHVL